MNPGRWLELLAFYPSRRPCLTVRRFATRQLAAAMTEVRLYYKEDTDRVQLQLRGTDRRVVLADWCAPSLRARIDEAGRRARNHAW